MQGDYDTASPLTLSSSPAPPSPLPHERQVVWKQQQQQEPHAKQSSGAHLDPTSTAQNGKSFFGRIRVVVRCRPLQPDTEGDHTDNRVHAHGDEVIVCEKNNPSAGRSYRFDRVLTPDADQVTTFAEVAPLVDHVLDGFHATVFAYGQTGSGKTFTMDGLRYVASTSRPKGVTAMVPDPEGTPVEQHGIMPRIIQLLFDRARARQRASGDETGTLEDVVGDVDSDKGAGDDDGVEYTFRCSYYQIYNEKITDLLRQTGSSPNPNGNDGTAEDALQRPNGAGAGRAKRRFDDGGLKVRWQKGDVFKVENLFVCSCASPDEMREMLFTGIQQKVVSSHAMNYQSSRSHCVFTIYVECRARKNGELRSQSELSLVDLAGSEKIGLLSSNPSAKLVKESIDINTSLLALGKVIMALSSSSNNSHNGSSSGAAGSRARRKLGAAAAPFAGGRLRGRGYGAVAHTAHIPYRDSKLTMLLKHALGGNSLTTMIACISPSDRYVEETTSTLLYAGRAKNIRNAPRVNEDATTTLIRQLREEIAQLKAELGYYREMAAKSLTQPNAETSNHHVCSRCGGAMTAGAAESPHASERSVETAVAAREAEQLADSLIAACEMLKNMMAVNAELRDAYDAVRDTQEASERREGELNAENLALRERLSVLEAIVLQDDDNNDVDDEEANEEADKTLYASRREADEASMDSATRAALEAAKQAAQAAAVLRANGGGYRSENASTTSPPHPPSSPASPSQQRPTLQQSASSASATPLQSSAVSPVSVSAARSTTSVHPPSPRVATEPARGRVVGTSAFKEALPPVVTDASTLAPPFGLVAPVATSPMKSGATNAKRKKRGQSSSRSASPATAAAASSVASRDATGQSRAALAQRKKKQAQKKKKHRVLARRLREYEQRYRAPSTSQTYEDYYAPAKKTSKPVAVSGVVPIRASGPEAAQTTATLEDMKVTVAKLPRNVVPEYVPASLLRPGLFGSLAFGGRQEERTEFEQHRADRMARLRALQQRQQELYQQVHQAVRDVSAERLDTAALTPQGGSVDVSQGALDARPGSSSNDAPVALERASEVGGSGRRSFAESGGRRSSAEQFSVYAPGLPRAPTAAYNDTKAAKKGSGSRRSTDSMSRLLEYLDKEKP